jgi:hypothetical protein
VKRLREALLPLAKRFSRMATEAIDRSRKQRRELRPTIAPASDRLLDRSESLPWERS